jgi:hypothetical protein
MKNLLASWMAAMPPRRILDSNVSMAIPARILPLGLTTEFARELHPYVRPKYEELLAAVAADRE